MKSYIKILGLFAAGVGMMCMTSCDETDAKKDEGKTPSVQYVRYCDPAEASEHIDGAYLGETVALIGSGMGDVQEIWFNDQKATLNPTMVTSHSIIVTIPSGISNNVTDMMTLVTSRGHKAEVPFHVLVPVPQVNSMSNEWANPGDEVTLSGLYMVNDEDAPLKVVFPGGATVDGKDIVSDGHMGATFTVPEGVQEGQIQVISRYGTGYSNFIYRDTRGMILDWDGKNGKAVALANGWRDGSKVVTDSFEGIPALDGKYACFNSVKNDRDAMDEDNASFNHWSVWDGEGHTPSLDPSSLFDASNWTGYTLKFEAFVPDYNPWTMCSLQIIWTSAELNNQNDYVFSDDYPRALWSPWEKTGSYTTGGKWVTVSVPLANANVNRYGDATSISLDKDSFKGLTFIVAWGPDTGLTEQTVILAVDNIRVAPLQEEMPEASVE